MKTVGFAGIGTMGSGMSRNLVKAGFEVFVYNRTKSKAAAIAGAKIVDTPAELCRKAEVIFTMVSNDAALKDVLFSNQGIMGALSGKNVLIDSSTTSVGLTEEVAEKCVGKGAEFIDAPVTGSKKGADEGTLVFMFGGKKETFEKCKRVFEAMGKRFVHCGPNSYSQRAKMALNITMAMILESYIEGVALALKEGVRFEAISEILENSGARNNVASVKMPAITAGNFTPQFMLELMSKDMGLASSEMEKLGLSLPLASAVVAVLKEGVGSGLGKEDWCAIVKVLEKKNKVKIGN